MVEYRPTLIEQAVENSLMQITEWQAEYSTMLVIKPNGREKLYFRN